MDAVVEIVKLEDPEDPADRETGLRLNETVGPLIADTLADNCTLPERPRLSRLIVD